MEIQSELADAGSLGFERPVSPNGYRWWYVDAFSDCGQYGMTLIFFIGSVFSPYYRSARMRGDADPRDFSCVNAIFYQPRSKLWTMTERRASDLNVSATTLQIGPSAMSTDGNTITVDLDERTAPLRRKLTGKVKLEMPSVTDRCYSLHSGGQHRWWPIAPVAKASIVLDCPELSWSGTAYMDSNAGVVPLEDTFVDWHWSRAALARDECRIVYEAHARDGETCLLTLKGSAEEGLSPEASAPRRDLPKGAVWQVNRPTRSYQGLEVVSTLEDTPFYTRSHLQGPSGDSVMHESLDLDRFKSRWVQTLLPFRIRKMRYGLAMSGNPGFPVSGMKRFE